MSYEFNFDLSKFAQPLFREIANFSHKEKIHEKMGTFARKIVKKFNVDKNTGLSLTDSLTIIEDLINIQIANSILREDFKKANKKALFLPHCSRKYMDSRCKAKFNSKTSSYICNNCSKDCMVNMATKLAKKEKFDVYVLPGGSCIRNICKKYEYQGIIGIACTDELRLGIRILDQQNIPAQVIPLIKNGCSETKFNFETLEKTIRNKN